MKAAVADAVKARAVKAVQDNWKGWLEGAVALATDNAKIVNDKQSVPLSQAKSCVVYEVSGTVYLNFNKDGWESHKADMDSWKCVSSVYDLTPEGYLQDEKYYTEGLFWFRSRGWIQQAVEKVKSFQGKS